MQKLCVIAVAALASTSVATASAPVVPPRVLNAVKREVNPPYAYAPTYAPAGARYWKWESSSSGRWLTIRFRKSGTSLEAFSFSAGPYAPLEHRCRGNLAGWTFHISGVTVYWAATHVDQDAWRCVRTQNGRVIALSAAQSVSGRGADNPRSHWARDLARIVASGRRIS